MGERLTRWRWRWRGAWLWPAFAAGIVADAVIGHLLPPAGESQHPVGAALVGMFFNLAAIILLSRPLGAVIRRRRPDMPRLIARDYGGALGVSLITFGLLLAGVIHRHVIDHHRTARRDAIVRAQAFIGARAPEPFRHELAAVDVYAIQPGRMYRVCVPPPPVTRSYCVVVDASRPLASSVRFAGAESNATFAQGAQ
jgi:hypothetical protein